MATERRAEIRRAAAAVFAEHGFDRASIRDVAKAAGSSLAGLYHHFRGKDEILFAIQHDAFETLLDRHAEALAGVQEPEDKLRRVIEVHVAFFAADIARMKVMSRESETLTGEYADQVRELRRRYVRLVRGILEELQRAGRLRDLDPGVAVFVLFGMMNWLYTWYDPDRETAEGVARHVATIFLDGVLR